MARTFEPRGSSLPVLALQMLAYTFVPRRLERVQSGQLMRFDDRLSKRDQTRDSELNPRASVEIRSHEALLGHILQRSNELWVVLSEPGDGKTRLLLEWAKMQAQQLLLGNPWLVPVPLLAQCGFLQTSSLQRDQNQFPWLLFALSTQPSNPRKMLEDLQQQKTKLPALLFIDAIDELPIELVTALAASLENLPFRVVLSCRREDWNARWRDLLPKARENTYRLLPLNSSEQQQFLEHWASKNNRDALWASELHKKLRSQPALVNISETVLLLALIARVYDQDAGSLPGSRDEFYQRALNAMWQRKTSQKRVSEIRIDEQMWLRDQLLTKLALVIFKQGSNRGVFNFADFMQATLESGLTRHEALPILERLKDTGIVLRRSNQIEPQYWFAHRTFQEYALMRAWMLDSDHAVTPEELTARLKAKLFDHWQEEELLEPLALCIAYAHRQQANVYEALDAVIQIGLQPEELARVKVSPLRRALHLLQQAGVEFQGGEKDKLLEYLGSHYRKLAMARDLNCPHFLLEVFASENDIVYPAFNHTIAFEVAQNLNTPPKVFEKLLQINNAEVLRPISDNINCPYEILAHSDAEFIRHGVADNRSTLSDILVMLSKDKNDSVRQSVALNSNTPIELLYELLRDPCDYVRRDVVANENLPIKFLTEFAIDENEEVRLNVVRNPNTPLELFVNFAYDKSERVRMILAVLPRTPIEILEKLAGDSSLQVLNALAQNVNTPPLILEKMFQDNGEGLYVALATNVNAPKKILEFFVTQEDDPELHSALAYNASTPTTVIEKLASNTHYRVRNVLAVNPNTPLATIKDLTNDPHQRVRKSAFLNPNSFVEWIPNTDSEQG